jgi:hypothetical protein
MSADVVNLPDVVQSLVPVLGLVVLVVVGGRDIFPDEKELVRVGI